MYILGINAFHADASAALFRDGQLIAASEEERFRRVKHWAGFPSEAIRFCLQDAGITLDEVDHIAIGRDPFAKLGKKFLYLLQHPGSGWKTVADRFRNSQQVANLSRQLALLPQTGTLHDLKRRTHYIEHHRSHLSSAFFASPFEEAAVLSVDGSGDFSTTMTAVGKGKQIRVLDSVDFPHSLGFFYTAFTQFLGFPHYGDEYKIMGLAPYGKPVYTDALHNVLHFKEDGLFSLNLKYFRSPSQGIITYTKDFIPQMTELFSDSLIQEFGPPRKAAEPLTSYHKDLAASVQTITEELIFHLLHHLHKVTGLKQLCLAGGVAQNSVANGKIVQRTPFEKVYIPSAGHDAGISMGAALYVHNQILGQPRCGPVWSAYTGSRYTNEQIEIYLQSRNIPYQKLDDDQLFEVVAERLINAGVVGWFTGRAEFGPRALGGRSILADPRRADAKQLLNDKIKRREGFRPFAPSILKEYVSDYFEFSDYVPFMEKVFPIRQDKRSQLPAVTHADGTGRLQTVDRTISPRYYGLIETFFKKTGVPVLLNTSFNENEPIVNAPGEALDCYLRTNMDMLVLENCIISRT